MRFSEVMRDLGLGLFPTIALFLFLAMFALVLWRVLSPSLRETDRRTAQLPLDDARPADGLQPHADANRNRS